MCRIFAPSPFGYVSSHHSKHTHTLTPSHFHTYNTLHRFRSINHFPNTLCWLHTHDAKPSSISAHHLYSPICQTHPSLYSRTIYEKKSEIIFSNIHYLYIVYIHTNICSLQKKHKQKKFTWERGMQECYARSTPHADIGIPRLKARIYVTTGIHAHT